MKLIYKHLQFLWKRMGKFMMALYILFLLFLILTRTSINNGSIIASFFMIDYTPYFYYLIIVLGTALIFYLWIMGRCYAQGKDRWLLLLRFHRERMIADLLFLFLSLLILYLMSYMTLYFEYHDHLDTLTSNGNYFIKEQQTFSAMIQDSSYLRYVFDSTPVSIILHILQLFTLSTAALSFISIERTLQRNKVHLLLLFSGCLILPYAMTLENIFLQIILNVAYILIFIYIINRSCTVKEIGG